MLDLGVRGAVVVLVAAAVSVLGDGPSPTAAAGPTGPTATCNGVPATIVGTARPDKLVGTSGDDVIVGFARRDVIDGGGGNDLICGSGGADWLIGGPGDDELRGEGSRIVRGDGDVHYSRDRLSPGPGDDTLVPGFDGGDHESSWDLLDFSDAATGIVGDVATDTITGDGTDTVVGDHYAILGTPYDDVLTGDGGEDELYGGDGNDVLRGRGGDDSVQDSSYLIDPATGADEDVIDGGPGDDHLSSDTGIDDVRGGDGDDLIGIWGNVGAHLDAGAGRDSMYIDFVLSDDQSYDAGPGFDEVRLSGAYVVDGQLVHPRTIIDLAAGTASVPSYDLAFPFAGADDLDAALSALTWYGTDRRDRVAADPTFSETARRFIAYGRGGNDRIRGTEKADFIDGGAGYDRADGYAGRDECVAVEVMRSC